MVLIYTRVLKAVGVDGFRCIVCNSSGGYCSLLPASRGADTSQ